LAPITSQYNVFFNFPLVIYNQNRQLKVGNLTGGLTYQYTGCFSFELQKVTPTLYFTRKKENFFTDDVALVVD
jgi:hypothetical protein